MITTVRYGFTFNKGNYESERIELEASIDPEQDDAVEVTLRLRALVMGLGGKPELEAQAEQAAESRVTTRERNRQWYQ